MSNMQGGPSRNDPQQYGPPQCGPPPQYWPSQAAPPKKRKTWPWALLAAVVIVLGMSACTAGGGQDAETTSGGEESIYGAEEEGSEEADEGEETVGVGDTGEVGDWMVTVNSTETAGTFGGEFTEKQAQGEFVIVDLTVENGGSEATTFDSSALSLIDADGNSHSASTTLEADSFFLEQINPGNQATGRAAFDVPEGTEAVALEVSDIWSMEAPLEIRLD
ncbi:DUF4352 domain-containing protein [Nocardiopsis terrae]